MGLQRACTCRHFKEEHSGLLTMIGSEASMSLGVLPVLLAFGVTHPAWICQPPITYHFGQQAATSLVILHACRLPQQTRRICKLLSTLQRSQR